MKDGRILSFLGATAGREPFFYEDSSFSGSHFWIQVVKSVPLPSSFLKKMGLYPPSRSYFFGSPRKPDDIFLWISTVRVSANARNDSYGSASATSESSIAIDINGVNIEIQDAATGQTFRATGTGGGVIDANRCISHIEVPGMGKKTEKVLLTLREKDEMGILQEKAVLEVDLP